MSCVQLDAMERCWSIVLKRSIVVSNARPASVHVYDYYAPGNCMLRPRFTAQRSVSAVLAIGGFKGAKGVMAPITLPPTTSRRSHLASLECKKTIQRPELCPGPHRGS